MNIESKNHDILNLKEMLNMSAKLYKDKTAYILENRNISYTDLLNDVNFLGTAMYDLHLEKKNIAIISENRYEWEVSYFAIVCGVGTVVPIDKSLTKVELKNILDLAKVEAVFCSKNYISKLKEIKNKSKYLKYIISFDGNINNIVKIDDSVLYFNNLIENGKKLLSNNQNVYINSKLKNDETNFIIFTSGTTKEAKAVMLSHNNICSNLVNISKVFKITSKDVVLSVLPLNHVLEGIFCFLLSIFNGATRVYNTNVDNIFEDIEKYNITFLGAVPAIYKYIYEKVNVDKMYLSHLKSVTTFFCAGAKLDVVLQQKCKNIGINILQGYGMTETSTAISLESKQINKIGSVGKIIPDIKLDITNEDNDGVGEIIVKGPNVMLGYYNNVDETNKVLRDKWFYTGDLARIDNEGFIYLYGRTKDIIVLENGKKIFPEEIETLINKLKFVKESFIFETDNNILNVKIVYDKKQIKGLSREKIKKLFEEEVKKINEELPLYKRIKKIYISSVPLLKTASIKIKRVEEKEKTISRLKGSKKNKINSNREDIKYIVLKILSDTLYITKEEISFDDKLVNDLGADSLDKAEIMLKIEKKFDIKINSSDSIKFYTVEDIIKYLNKVIR